jgi:hypothetical protein
MSDSKLEFLPFHAINEFMRNDYRNSVIRAVLNALPTLPANRRETIDRLTRKYVKVPGFRNSEKAPTLIKLLPMAKAFEKNSDLVAEVIAAWAENQVELRQQIYDLLKERGWQLLPADLKLEGLSLDLLKEWGILPLEVDRTRLPGFYTHWPKNENFETLYQAFTDKYPEVDQSIDNVSLMVVWLSLRLPVHVEGAEAETGEEAPGETNATPQA